ncbi:MAG: plastocyanin/azurin family copper-binding protein [Candidatus Bathyarchaeia archaeon]
MKTKSITAAVFVLLAFSLLIVGFYNLYLHDIGVSSSYLRGNRAGNRRIQVVVVKIPRGAAENLHINFEPAVISLQIGVNNTVTWMNEDDDWHTAHSNIPEFYSNLIQPGGNFTHTFERPGVYPYHCDPHPWMTGKITVNFP